MICVVGDGNVGVQEIMVESTFTLRHLAEASIQSDLQRLTHTDDGVNHARRQPAGQEQLGLGVLLRDTSTLGGAGDRTSILPVTSQPEVSLKSFDKESVFYI